ncbi:MAG: carbohydrate ABC transporter permease [Oscillospiraceae bacterium]
MKEKILTKLKNSVFLAPSLLGVTVFFVIPFFVVIYYALIDNQTNHEFVGLDNIKNVLENGAFRLAFANTMKFSAIAVPLSVLLSMGMAIMLDCNIRFRSFIRTSFLCPLMVPTASVVLIWQVIFSYNGSLNEFIMKFGLDKIDWLKSKYGMYVVALLFLWKNLGYNMILFISALNNIPTDIVEVATLEGASPFYKFIHIKLRYISPTIFFVTILSLINSFKVFREVYLLAGNYPYDSLYMIQHFMNNTFNSLDYQKLSSAAIITALVMAVIIAVLFAAESRFGKDVEG